MIWTFCRLVSSLGTGEPGYIVQFVSFAAHTESLLPPRLDGILDHYLWILLLSFLHHKEALGQCLGDFSSMCLLIANMHGGGAKGQKTYDFTMKADNEAAILASELSSWEVVDAGRFED